MNCSPLRGVRAEMLIPEPRDTEDTLAAATGTAAEAVDLLGCCDTSLDDEFAEQQQQQRQGGGRGGEKKQMMQRDEMMERKYDDGSDPTLSQLAAESLPSDEEEEEEEQARPSLTLPTPTPAPHHSATPSHSMHSPAHEVSFSSLHATSSSPFARLVTPPARLQQHRHSTPASASAMRASPLTRLDSAGTSATSAPVHDYRGTPIDCTMRRNLLAGSSPAEQAHSDAFRSAAAASLSLTAPHSLLQSMASPAKSVHLHRLEAQMAALSSRTPQAALHSSNRFQSPHWSETPPSHPFSRADADTSLLQVEQSSVEEAPDAVEEMGKHDSLLDTAATAAAAAQRFDHVMRREEKWMDAPLHEALNSPQSLAAAAPRTANDAVLLFSPISADSASPFVSPPTAAAAAARSHEMRVSRATAPVSSLPSSSLLDWPQPVELSKLTSKKVGTHSRYDQRQADRERKGQSSLLAAANLPKIAPPTLEAWQREAQGSAATVAINAAPTYQTSMAGKNARRPVGKEAPAAVTSAVNSSKMQSNLTLLKRKAALKASSPPASGTGTAASRVTARPRSSSSTTTTAASSLTTLARVPLASLPLHTVVANPWSSETERAQEQARPFHTPLKRFSATTAHTPATATAEEPEQQEQLVEERPTGAENQHVRLYDLPPPLLPSAQPVQTYRAIVNGVHVRPPALSWIATHHIEPDRIHANLRYLTTAYAHAD